ncbi:MAG: amidohydrolase family protein [Armatimonadota bacterium]
MSLRWIDTHIHVSDIGPDGRRRERMLHDLLEVLDRDEADLRFLISCDGPYLSRIGSDADGMLAANRMVHGLVSGAPGRLYGSCCVNPRFTDEALRVMDLAFGTWGFVQLGEMLPYMHGYRMDSDEAERVVRHAVEHDVAVQVHLGTYWHKDHTGSTDGMDHMRDLLRCHDRVPEAKYILAHAIGCGPTPDHIPWADMFLDAMQGVFGEWPRTFWIEVRDFQSDVLPRLIAEVPTDRILAGTDWTTRVGPPFQDYGTMFGVEQADNPFPPRVASLVGFLRAAGASEEDTRRIGWGNAAELYGLRQ